jgi:hypothetical protein
MRKPIVWIVKEQVRRLQTGVEAMDYTPAMKYGELRFITDFDPPTHAQKSTLLEAWGKSVRAFLKEFDPRTDFVVASGQPTAMMLIAWLMGIHQAANVPPLSSLAS